MRAVLQRVRSARVTVADEVTGEIGPGLLIFLGITGGDTAADLDWLVGKIVRLRLFDDLAGRLNLSLLDTAGAALVVSQFTLYASTRKGTRPSFHGAAPPAEARPLYETFVARLATALRRTVPTGEFGAMMHVSLVNDGPVTLVLDSRTRD